MIKKIVNGEIKNLTDTTISGIKVYSCVSSKREDESSSVLQLDSENTNVDIKDDRNTKGENDTREISTRESSALDGMSLFR